MAPDVLPGSPLVAEVAISGAALAALDKLLFLHLLLDFIGAGPLIVSGAVSGAPGIIVPFINLIGRSRNGYIFRCNNRCT